MTAYFTATVKRRNSTHVPGWSGITPTTINLKDRTDIVKPIFEVQTLANPRAYNYVYVSTLARHYFIDKWEYGGSIWYAHCTVDVLATYLNTIQNATKYVLRSSSNPSVDVTDTFYPMTDNVTHAFTGTDLAWSHDFSTGWYVVGLMGYTAQSVSAGSVTYYVMSASQMATLVQYMLSGLTTMDWSNLAEIKTNIERIMADPLQYIVSCLYFPFQPPLGMTTTVSFGFWTVPGLQANLLGAAMDTIKNSLLIYQIAGFNERNSPFFWRYLEPMTSYVLQFNPFGTFPIPAAYVAGHYYLGYEIKTDYITGAALCNLYAHDSSSPTSFGRTDQLVTSQAANIGVQIQLSQNTSSLLTAVTKGGGGVIGGAVAGAQVGGVAGAIVGGVLGGALATPTALRDSFASSGAIGGISGDEGTIYLHSYRRSQAVGVTTAAELGHACYQTLRLGDLSGYILCADGEIQVACLAEEKQMISDYLTSGIYMEQLI